DRGLPLRGVLGVADEPTGANVQAHQDRLDLFKGRSAVLAHAAIEDAIDGAAVPAFGLNMLHKRCRIEGRWVIAQRPPMRMVLDQKRHETADDLTGVVDVLPPPLVVASLLWGWLAIIQRAAVRVVVCVKVRVTMWCAIGAESGVVYMIVTLEAGK